MRVRAGVGAAVVAALVPFVGDHASAGAVAIAGRPDNGGIRYAYSESFTLPGTTVSCDINGFVRVANDTGDISGSTFVTGDDPLCRASHVALEIRTSERTISAAGDGPSVGGGATDPGDFEQSRHSAWWDGCPCQHSFTIEPK